MIDPGPIPAFLLAPKGSRKVIVSRRRWAKIRVERPEGAKWEAAERWEVCIPDAKEIKQSMGDLAPGTRCVWVLYAEGHKWAELRDAEGYAKLPARLWEQMARKGRRIDR